MHQLREANFDKKLNTSLSSNKPCHRFSLDEILLATQNFDDAFVIGRGGYGMVYKGFIDNGVCTVAVKRLNSMSKQGAPEFWTEIEMLSKIRHSHIISLIGYCNDGDEMIIVYEYMVHGTLSDHLHNIGKNCNSPLPWVQRLKICIGAARGLDYLHTGTGVHKRVIHRDVKSSNILLNEKWTAKISDFGMSKIGPANQPCTHVSTLVKGTLGYVDPEYLLTHKLTRKSDVYAFGVVLFEALCGRPALNLRLNKEQRGLARWVRHCIKEGIVDQIIDPSLRGHILPNCLTVFLKIAGKCLDELPKKRPTMAEIVARLEFALELEERRDSAIVEWEIFNKDGIYDSEKNGDSSMKQQEDVNPGHGGQQDEHFDGIIRLGNASNVHSWITSAKKTFPRKMRLFYRGKCLIILEKQWEGIVTLWTSLITCVVAERLQVDSSLSLLLYYVLSANGNLQMDLLADTFSCMIVICVGIMNIGDHIAVDISLVGTMAMITAAVIIVTNGVRPHSSPLPFEILLPGCSFLLYFGFNWLPVLSKWFHDRHI